MEKPAVLILDVDGVLTNGHFYYTEDGKYMKAFGPDDNDALRILSKYMEIRFITGDRSGYNISHRRIVTDMHYKLDLVSTLDRLEWIQAQYSVSQVAYMGDGIFDHYTMSRVGYSIAPSNADENAKRVADYVTSRKGGERAVSEACLHILKIFFRKELSASKELDLKFINAAGEWAI